MKTLKLLSSLIIVLCVSFIFTGQQAYASNWDYIVNFLQDEMGFNRAVAIGIATNIDCESSCNPNAYNSAGYYGICQWGGSRLTNLKNFCSSHGWSSNNLYAQLKFLQHELSSSQINRLKSFPNNRNGAYNAAYFFAQDFERCYSGYYNSRGNLASRRF